MKALNPEEKVKRKQDVTLTCEVTVQLVKARRYKLVQRWKGNYKLGISLDRCAKKSIDKCCKQISYDNRYFGDKLASYYEIWKLL